MNNNISPVWLAAIIFSLLNGCDKPIVIIDDWGTPNNPRANIIFPEDGYVAYRPFTIKFNASADNILEKAELYIDDSTSADRRFLLPPFEYVYTPGMSEGLDTTYHKIYVKAYERNGKTAVSQTVTVKTPNFLPPFNFSLSNQSENAVTLNWVNQAVVKNYSINVERKNNDNDYALFLILNTSYSSLPLTDLDNKKSYSYLFQLNKDGYKSIYSDTVTINYTREKPKEKTFKLTGLTNIIDVKISKDGKLMALAGADKCVLLNANNLSLINEFDAGGSVSFSPDNNYLSLLKNNNCLVINLISGEQNVILSGMTELRHSLLLAGNRLLFSDGNELRIVDLFTGDSLHSFVFPGHLWVSYSEQLNAVAVSKNKTVKIYDLNNFNAIKEFGIQYGSYYSIKFSADGNYLLLVSSSGDMYVYSTLNFSLVMFIENFYLNSRDVGISRDGSAVAYTYQKRYADNYLSFNWGSGENEALLNDVFDFVEFNTKNNYIYLISLYGKVVMFQYQDESSWLLKN